ncbi:lipase [Amycolatopsis sp. WAC 04182]|uniref:SGNH/GDSL hydrolase family protein n=1 Tax=Amycolatopsis sp. WAC 04182 TaxID=2203198 RepID=UPI000F7B6C03|nr:SGNH/GDSL hydrolase family protein [Amycolatopsis sp. WAC 04182]RSN59232.1 lipase [Amycolatopsis sp. WAC 04182]
MITIPLVDGPVAIRGALDIEHTPHGLLPHRLPAAARARFPDNHRARFDGQPLTMVEAQPAGVRLVFRTAATIVELDVLPTKTVYKGAPAVPDGGYDLVINGRLAAQAGTPAGNRLILDMPARRFHTTPGRPGTVRFDGLPAEPKDVEIWLPQAEITELIALRTDAPVDAPTTSGRRWLHHGSSLSHCAEAASPTGTWPAVAARLAGVELTNLGLGTNALLDPFVARAIRDADTDLISLKIGLNLVTGDLMRLRAFGPAVHGFLDTIRDGHPDTPILVVSPILSPIVEDVPGPVVPDFDATTLRFRALGVADDLAGGRLCLSIVRDELARITTERADPHLHYLDGRALFGEQDHAELPPPDGLHLDPAGYQRLGERFARLAFNGPFA